MSKLFYKVLRTCEPLPTLYIRTQKVNIYINMQIKRIDNQPLTKIAYLLLQLFLVSSRIYQNNFCTFAQLKTGQKPTNDQTMKNLKSFLLFIFALYSFGASIVLCTLVNDNNLMGALAIISICIVSGIVSLNTMLTSK